MVVPSTCLKIESSLSSSIQQRAIEALVHMRVERGVAGRGERHATRARAALTVRNTTYATAATVPTPLLLSHRRVRVRVSTQCTR